LLKKNKKQKTRPPAVEEFLGFIPKKAELEWNLTSDGVVEIKVPKFKSKLGKSFCKFIRKENIFNARMDKIGTVVWLNSDGKKTVKDILEILKKEFPDERNIDQRLFLFLQKMHSLGYIELLQILKK